jgi:hypothetical protein
MTETALGLVKAGSFQVPALIEYLETSGLRNRPNAPLFPIALGKTRKLGNRPATRIDAARMLKRRLKDAGLSDAFSPIPLGLPE